MRSVAILAVCQALFTGLQVYLVSKISTIGKIGIALFYHEYRVFRNGWQTFLLFYGIQLAVILLLYFTRKKSGARLAMIVSSTVIFSALAGLLLTYNDFKFTYSHRLLKERFHLAFYLFWLGIMATGIFFLISTRSPSAQQQGQAEY